MPKPDISIHTNQIPRSGVHAGVALREDSIYTDAKGRESDGIRKKAQKALEKLQEPLSKLLLPGEVVLHVATRAQAPVTTLEQMTMGWYIQRVTATILVFTNQRILQFLVKSDGSWKRHVRSVAWGDLAEARVKGWLFSFKLELTYRNGKKETYWGLWRANAKKIQALLAALIPTSRGEASTAQAMVSLCPDCWAVLTPGVYQCPQCRLVFKNEGTMVMRSLLIPGGGYFYCGQKFLGFGDFIAEAYLLLVLAWFVLNASIGPASTEDEQMARAGYWILAVILALAIALEKWMTIHHCRRFIRDFIPAK